LAEALKINSTLQHLWLHENDIGVCNVMAIAHALYFKSTLQRLRFLSWFGIGSTDESSSSTPTDHANVRALIHPVWLEYGGRKIPVVDLVVVLTLAAAFLYAFERIWRTLYGETVQEDLTADCSKVYGVWNALLNLVVSVTRTAVFHYPLERVWTTPRGLDND
jgi:hypothetical protein